MDALMYATRTCLMQLMIVPNDINEWGLKIPIPITGNGTMPMVVCDSCYKFVYEFNMLDGDPNQDDPIENEGRKDYKDSKSRDRKDHDCKLCENEKKNFQGTKVPKRPSIVWHIDQIQLVLFKFAIQTTRPTWSIMSVANCENVLQIYIDELLLLSRSTSAKLLPTKLNLESYKSSSSFKTTTKITLLPFDKLLKQWILKLSEVCEIYFEFVHL